MDTTEICVNLQEVHGPEKTSVCSSDSSFIEILLQLRIYILHTIENRRSPPAEFDKSKVCWWGPIFTPGIITLFTHLPGRWSSRLGEWKLSNFPFIMAACVFWPPPLISVNLLWKNYNIAKGLDIILLFCTIIVQSPRQTQFPPHKIFH